MINKEPSFFFQKHWLFSLSLLLIVSLSCSFFIGKVSVTPMDIFSFLRHFFTQQPLSEDLAVKMVTFFYVRLPRCLLAVLGGMTLSVAGAVYQGMFRNPIVSPNILGLTAGCTFGAALGLLLPGAGWVWALSFIFGLTAVGLVLMLSRLIKSHPILVLVLLGLVISAVFDAFVMIMKFVADPYSDLPAIVFWTMGSTARGTWGDLKIIFPTILISLIFFYVFRYRLNVLSLGDLEARTLGVRPGVYRFFFIAISTLMVSMITATCGQIGWVGLIIPHIARIWVGPNHEKAIPACMFIGGIFLLWADIVARSVFSMEIPLGIITALVGAPFFAFLLYYNRESGWL